MGKEEIKAKLKNAVIELDPDLAVAAAKEAVAAGMTLVEVIDEGLSQGMQVISDMFDEGEAFVPELMLAGEAFESAVKVINEAMAANGVKSEPVGKILIHTVEGDVHDIGKNIVTTMLGANNFEVHDLGRDVAVRTVVEKAQELDVDIIVGSALMSTTMPRQREIVDLLIEKGLRDRFIVMFGGAPVTEKWCDSIGAQGGYSDQATETPGVAKKLLAQKRGK